jgi:hypothetical protein
MGGAGVLTALGFWALRRELDVPKPPAPSA